MSDDLERVERLAALDDVPQRLAREQLHTQVELAVRQLVAVVDRDHVAVAQQRERAGLADEPLAAIRAKLERLVEDLHRDDALELEVDPAPHGPHPALADLLEDLDPTGEHPPWWSLRDKVRRVLVLVEQKAVLDIGLLVRVLDILLVRVLDILLVRALLVDVSRTSSCGCVVRSLRFHRAPALETLPRSRRLSRTNCMRINALTVQILGLERVGLVLHMLATVDQTICQ
jgi:hypothetical protein